MPRRRRSTKQAPADREIDFHGATAAQMRAELDLRWAGREWHGVRNVRVIHGTGEVLWRELHRWCREKGIEFTLEAHQGATLLHPGQRLLANASPSHRPLAPLKRQIQAVLPETESRRAHRKQQISVAPETGDDSHKDGLAPAEGDADSVQSAISHVPTESRATPEDPNISKPQHRNTESPDLMAEEFASLAAEDLAALRLRKHATDPTSTARHAAPKPPTVAPTIETPASRAPAPRKDGAEDLFAREFERLGREDPHILRRRKGSG